MALKHQWPLAPVEDWMLREGAFTQGGPEIIWRAWSVMTAGCALVLTYMAGFVLWTVGFATLARHRLESEAGRVLPSKERLESADSVEEREE